MYGKTVAELSRDASLLKKSAGNGHGDAVAGVYEYEIDSLLLFSMSGSTFNLTLTFQPKH